jgi:hypothetical protein
MALASILLGIFAAVPIADTMSATIAVMGTLAGYYLSQLSPKASIIYDHGILLWGLPVTGHAAYSKVPVRSMSLSVPMFKTLWRHRRDPYPAQRFDIFWVMTQ